MGKCSIQFQFVFYTWLYINDTLAEWLRRRPAKPMGSPRVGSNPTGVVLYLCIDIKEVCQIHWTSTNTNRHPRHDHDIHGDETWARTRKWCASPNVRTVWPSGLRRWLQAPVRKGVGSNPTAVTQLHATGEPGPYGCFSCRWSSCSRGWICE